MLKGLETVVYFVEDMRAATDWYKKVLAIEPNHDTPMILPPERTASIA